MRPLSGSHKRSGPRRVCALLQGCGPAHPASELAGSFDAAWVVALCSGLGLGKSCIRALQVLHCARHVYTLSMAGAWSSMHTCVRLRSLLGWPLASGSTKRPEWVRPLQKLGCDRFSLHMHALRFCKAQAWVRSWLGLGCRASRVHLLWSFASCVLSHSAPWRTRPERLLEQQVGTDAG